MFMQIDSQRANGKTLLTKHPQIAHSLLHRKFTDSRLIRMLPHPTRPNSNLVFHQATQFPNFQFDTLNAPNATHATLEKLIN